MQLPPLGANSEGLHSLSADKDVGATAASAVPDTNGSVEAVNGSDSSSYLGNGDMSSSFGYENGDMNGDHAAMQGYSNGGTTPMPVPYANGGGMHSGYGNGVHIPGSAPGITGFANGGAPEYANGGLSYDAESGIFASALTVRNVPAEASLFEVMELFRQSRKHKQGNRYADGLQSLQKTMTTVWVAGFDRVTGAGEAESMVNGRSLKSRVVEAEVSRGYQVPYYVTKTGVVVRDRPGARVRERERDRDRSNRARSGDASKDGRREEREKERRPDERGRWNRRKPSNLSFGDFLTSGG